MQQPIIMSHHQIAYAAQATANQVAQQFKPARFGNNSTNNNNISNTKNIQKKLQDNVSPPPTIVYNPMPQHNQATPFYYYPTYVTGHPMGMAGPAAAAASHIPIQNFFSNQGKINYDQHLSRSSSPKNSSSSHLSDHENSTGSLLDVYDHAGYNAMHFSPVKNKSSKYHKKGSIASSHATSLGCDNSSSTSPTPAQMANKNSNSGALKGNNNKLETSSSHSGSAANQASSVSASNSSTKKQKPQKPVKKVIVINLPANFQSIESVTSKFHQYGEILLVRVIKPGKILPFDLKQFASKIHDLGETPCAIVEFEQASSAKGAVEKMRKENDIRLALLQADAADYLYEKDNNSACNNSHIHNESGIEVISSHHSDSDTSSSAARTPNVVRMSEVRPSTPVKESSSASKSNSKSNNSGSESSGSNNSNKQTQEKLAGKSTGKSKKITENNAKNNNSNNNIHNLPAAKTKRSQSVPHIITPRTCGWPVIAAHGGMATPLMPMMISTAGTHTQLIQATPTYIQPPKNLNVKAAEFVPRTATSSSGTPTVTDAKNGRVVTSLTVRLAPTMNSGTHRNTKKLDLTGRRHTLTEQQLKVIKSSIAKPRVYVNGEPAILKKNNTTEQRKSLSTRPESPNSTSSSSNSSNSDIGCSTRLKLHKYSRDYLLSLRETRKSLQLPKQLPNIPELIPTSKTPVMMNYTSGNTKHRYGKKKM